MKTTVLATLALAFSAAAAPLAGYGSERHILPRTHRSHLSRRADKCEKRWGQNGSAGHNFAAEVPSDAPAQIETPAKENKQEAAAPPATNDNKHNNNDNKNQGQSGGMGGWASGQYSYGTGPDFLKVADGKYIGSGPREWAKGTFYSLENPAENHGYTKTACGIDNPPDTTPLVAISMKNWREISGGSTWNAPFCGHHVKVTYKGRSAIATVVDGCATCDYNHIDMSPVLFYYLTGSKEAGDRLGVMQGSDFSWEWVDDGAHTPGVSNFVELPSDGFHWDGAGGAGTSPY